MVDWFLQRRLHRLFLTLLGELWNNISELELVAERKGKFVENNSDFLKGKK